MCHHMWFYLEIKAERISRQMQVASICKLIFCKYTSHSLQVVNCKPPQVILYNLIACKFFFRQVMRQWQVGSLQRQVAFFISLPFLLVILVNRSCNHFRDSCSREVITRIHICHDCGNLFLFSLMIFNKAANLCLMKE